VRCLESSACFVLVPITVDITSRLFPRGNFDQCSQEAELGNEDYVRKIACQGVDIGRSDCRIH
jgi:hypothetical protein